MSKRQQFLKKHLVFRKETIFVIIIAVFFLLYAFIVKDFIAEDSKLFKIYSIYNNTGDCVDIHGKIFSVDPVAGKMNVKFWVEPRGNLYKNELGKGLTKNLIVTITNLSGDMEYLLKKNKTINVISADIPLDGSSTNYPFDKYKSDLCIVVEEAGNPYNLIPANIDLVENIQGFEIKLKPHILSYPNVIVLDIHSARSGTLKSVAIAGIILMWAMAIAVVFMTLTFTTKNYKVESLAFYSALLFALVGFRNSLPETPPVGTLSDYVGFFWVMGIVSIMMILKIIILLRRAPSQ